MYFVCMYVKEELAECIASLLQCFESFSTSLLFTKAFFMTQAREWSGTDQLRMDKFMMVNINVCASLNVIQIYFVLYFPNLTVCST